MNRAGVLAEGAIAAGERDARFFCLAAARRLQAGDTKTAVHLSLQAVELAPQDPLFLTSAGDALRYTGQPRDAVALFDRALAVDPMMVAAWYGRALALDSSGQLEQAARCYRRVSELAPDTAPGFAGLASIQAQLGQLKEARRNAIRAHDISPGDFSTNVALARCDLADGELAEAIDRLQAMTKRHDLAGEDRIVALGLLGDAFDKHGAVKEAFDAYTQANERFAEMHAGPNAPPTARILVESIEAALARLAPGALSGQVAAIDNEPKQHIFLLGFPRSGTTLVEQILATMPEVETLEEAPTLAAAQAEFLSGDGIGALAEATDERISQLRAAYWNSVAAQGIDVAGKTFVDMDPFKSASLPLIARLFPDAKLIVVRRDPRDVIWSCFRRNFVFSPATYEFTSLARAARLYAATMQLIDSSLKKLRLDVHMVQYENLVRDFDGETKALCDFLDLEWSAAVRDFANIAKGRAVKTASAPQVRRGLFDGSGQWRNYESQIAPVMYLLQRWLPDGSAANDADEGGETEKKSWRSTAIANGRG